LNLPRYKGKEYNEEPSPKKAGEAEEKIKEPPHRLL